MPTRKGDRNSRPGRPQAAPPALLFAPFESFEGFALVDELRSRTGVVLWVTVRNLLLWAQTPEDLRSKLFSEKALSRMQARLQSGNVPPAVQDPLNLLAEMLKEGSSIPATTLVQAAVKVSRWAGEQNLPQTAIIFAQAAALLVPDRADLSYQVGLLCRRSGQYARAETWFRRTIVLARRRDDAQSYAMAWNSLGHLYMRRGQHQAAERAFQRALRKSRRSGIQRAKAMALHNLFCVAVETGRIHEAELFAQKAAHAFKPTEPRLIVLAHDVAGLWLSQGFHGRALPVLRAVVPLIRSLSERLQAISALARAAAGVSDKGIFTTAWSEAWWIIDQSPELESVPPALVHLAHASAMLSDWERAELAGSYAVSLATKRNEEGIRVAAEEIWEVIRERRLADRPAEALQFPAEETEGSERLAQRLVHKLAACARRGITSPRTDRKACL